MTLVNSAPNKNNLDLSTSLPLSHSPPEVSISSPMATSSLPQAVQLVLSRATPACAHTQLCLSQWVKDNLARSTEANKSAVLTEMRAVISKAYQDQTLNTIDWPNYKLQRQAGPPSPGPSLA